MVSLVSVPDGNFYGQAVKMYERLDEYLVWRNR